MKFGLIGTFDVDNYGDCMFPELYENLLRERFGDCEIALFSPRPVASPILSFDRVNALPAWEDRAALATLNADTLILVGGETIGHGHSAGTFNFPKGTLSAYHRLWLAPLLAARDPELRASFFAAQSVGAIRMPDEVNRDVARCLAAADRVRFRDQFSAEWIRDGETSFAVDIDPMFLVDRLLTPVEWKARVENILPSGIAPGSYLAAQVSIGYGDNDLAAWADAIATIARMRDLPVVLVPICHFMEDEQLLARALHLVAIHGVEVHLVEGRRNVKDTAALVGQSAGYVGSSLHGAVTAVAFNRPLAALGHTLDGKHAGTLAAVGLTGIVATRSPELPTCFDHASTINFVAARHRAQILAYASVGALLDAVEAKKSEACPEGLGDAAARLIAAERNPQGMQDIKRLILRVVRETPGLAGLYRRWRLWRLLGRT